MSRVSVIIPCKNNLEYTKKCINSIVRYGKNCQLIVVDNDSNDGTSEYLVKTLKESDILVRNFTNVGFANACNQGSILSDREYLCFLNNDCEIGEGWLNQLLEGIKKADMIGSSMVKVVPNMQEKTFEYMGKGEENEEWSYLEGWCLFLRRKLFEDVGRFSIEFKPYLSEDADLSFKLKKAGFKISKINLNVKHYGSKTLRLEDSDKVRRTSLLNNQKLFNKWVKTDIIEQESKKQEVRELGHLIGEKKEHSRILVKRAGARGDVLLCTLLLKKLRDMNNGVQIDFETSCPEMLQNSSLVDNIISWGEASDGYDVVLQPKYEKVGCKNYVDEMAQSVGLGFIDRQLIFKISRESKKWARELIRSEKHKIVFHTGKTWKTRAWPLDRFRFIGKILQDKNCEILCIGDKNTDYYPEFGRDLRDLPIDKTAAIVKEADMVLGIDSMVIHLAAAVGTPAIVIYGCTSPSVVWTEGTHYPVWVSGLECKGCRHKTADTYVDCKRGDYACLWKISVDMVYEKIIQCFRDRGIEL